MCNSNHLFLQLSNWSPWLLFPSSSLADEPWLEDNTTRTATPPSASWLLIWVRGSHNTCISLLSHGVVIAYLLICISYWILIHGGWPMPVLCTFACKPLNPSARKQTVHTGVWSDWNLICYLRMHSDSSVFIRSGLDSSFQFSTPLIFLLYSLSDLLVLIWLLHPYAVGWFLCLPICSSSSPKMAAINFFSSVYTCHSHIERWSRLFYPWNLVWPVTNFNNRISHFYWNYKKNIMSATEFWGGLLYGNRYPQYYSSKSETYIFCESLPC